MEKIIAGPHGEVKVSDNKDCNGRFMVTCAKCGICAHEWRLEKAIEDLKKCACNPGCKNCNALNHSHDRASAIPLRGTISDETHVCPNDGVRWWQSNKHFHLWQTVTSDEEWNAIISS